MTFRVDFKWVDAGSSVDQFSSSTMAELRIVVGEKILTSHVDRETHTHGDEITVPLYPIAEWLTSWWWPIFHEYGEWVIAADAEYLQRHDLAFADRGFVYPGVLLQPTGSFMEISSRRALRVHSPIEFLGGVSANVPIDEVKSEFAKLIGAVVERLRQHKIRGSDVESDWQAISELTPEELEFSKAAGRFGLDPFDIRVEDAEAIVRLTGVPEVSLRDDLFSLGPPRVAEALLDKIRDAHSRAEKGKSGSAWSDLAKTTRPSTNGELPWKSGYAIANWARERLKLDGEPVDFKGHTAVGTVALESDHHRLRGVIASRSPACALQRGVPATHARFTKARAVGDFLMRGSGGPLLLTTMRTDGQAQARAFAAEFLAPADGIRRRIRGQTGGWIDDETVDELAHEFDVSTFVIAHQIKNHELGQVSS